MSRRAKWLSLLGASFLLNATCEPAPPPAIGDAAGRLVTERARAFVSSLNPEQIGKGSLEYGDPLRVSWTPYPLVVPPRGLMLMEMEDEQRQRAYLLLESVLSEIGYTKSRTIMALETLMRELDPRHPQIRNPDRYTFCIYGTPQEQGEWGLSIEGHHLSLNFVVRDSQVVGYSPAFLGVDPGEVRETIPSGPAVGTKVLDQEEKLGFAMLDSLTAAQRSVAIVSATPFEEVSGIDVPQPPREPPIGLSSNAMTAEQRTMLQALVGAYLANFPDSVAAARRAEIEQSGLDKLYFAWAGGTDPAGDHSYRVQGPTFLLELTNNRLDYAGNTANHPHALWRNLQGDFNIPF